MKSNYEQRQERLKSMHLILPEVARALGGEYRKLYDHYGEITGADFVIDCCLFNDGNKYIFRASNIRKIVSSNLYSRKEMPCLEIGASFDKSVNQLVSDIRRRLILAAKDAYARAERLHEETINRGQAKKRTEELLQIVPGLEKYNSFDNQFGGNIGGVYVNIRTSVNGGIERLTIRDPLTDHQALKLLKAISELN